jgi:hypothetical protein
MANVKISEIVGGEDANPASTAMIEIEQSGGTSKWATLANSVKNIGSAIKTAYEGQSNTNAFTDADATKLDGIEALANVTDAASVLAAGAVMTTGAETIAGVKTFSIFPDTQ